MVQHLVDSCREMLHSQRTISPNCCCSTMDRYQCHIHVPDKQNLRCTRLMVMTFGKHSNLAALFQIIQTSSEKHTNALVPLVTTGESDGDEEGSVVVGDNDGDSDG